MPPMIAAGIGAAGSAISSGKSGKGKPSGQTTTTQQPFGPLASSEQLLLNAANQALVGPDPTRDLGTGLAPLSDQTQQALSMLQGIGSGNSGDANELQHDIGLSDQFARGNFGMGNLILGNFHCFLGTVSGTKKGVATLSGVSRFTGGSLWETTG